MRGPSSGSAHCRNGLQQDTTNCRKKIRVACGNSCVRARGVRSALLLYCRRWCVTVVGYREGEKKYGGGSVMELRTASPRKYDHTRPVNLCAQCGETIFLPEWSEYLDRHRVRHLWECEACGYKFETLISFPES